MCLITKQLEPIILEEDMEVVKLVNKDLSPYYQSDHLPYIIGELYKVDKLGINKQIYPNNDFIFTTPSEGGFIHNLLIVGECVNVIDIGYHSIIPDSKLHIEFTGFKFHDGIFINCIIPKGSIIYKNEYGNIVSNQIIIKEKI